jgi:GNAT superfamily N-acetyltransferase
MAYLPMRTKTQAAIRRASAADAALLPDIERSAARAFEKLPDLGWMPGTFVISVEDHLASNARGTLWVAEERGSLVGFLTAHIAGDELHIDEFNVRLDWQGQGIGRKLVAAVVSDASDRKLRAVTLTTFRKVPWNGPFYERVGFKVSSGTDISARLQAILDREVEHGLPREKRCVMRMMIGS